MVHMKHRKRVTKGKKSSRRSAKLSTGGAQRKRKPRKSLSLSAVADDNPVSMREVMEFYKPIKKPVTLRLDADVLAWFRREGRRYQTRINSALRTVMEREMKKE